MTNPPIRPGIQYHGGGKAACVLKKPDLAVTVFSDYICPFCYIGERRLSRLSEYFDLAVDRRFLEIHPDTPADGMPVSWLGYPPEQWRQMMEHLFRMADEEDIPLAERKITTNSHRALLLAEAVKEEGADAFDALNGKLFSAFFCEGRNIGDESVLRDLAEEAGVSSGVVDRAWTEQAYEDKLRSNREAAARLGIQGVPTFIIGNRILAGAVPTQTLLIAARETGTPFP